MFGIKTTVNGKLLGEEGSHEEIIDLNLQLTIKIVSEQILSVLTPEEAKQILLNFELTEDSLIVSVTGYEETVEKALAAIGQQINP